MEDADTDIAIIGIGCNFPGGEGVDSFWRVLLQGKNCAVQIPDERFNLSHWYDPDDNKPGKSRTAKAALLDGFNAFDHKFFGITDAEVDQMDPQHKLLLQCTYRALEDAGIPMEKASGTKTGVFLGLMNRDYELSTINVHPNIINHCTGTGIAMSIAANRISYTYNFTGPSLSIDCACSSSLVALHFACQAIRQGDCEMAVCGGVNCIIEPRVFVALSKAKMISPDGTSKSFSSTADGYGRGEGCGIVLLKPLKKALQDFNPIWGIISKTAVNQDGHTVTPITKPSMVQQEELLSRIYSTENDLANVQYIEAHGTGTPIGDPIEAQSISTVIAKARPPGSGPLYVGSVKANIGHTESAAGVAGLIKVLLMMKHETIVPSVFYSEDNSSIDAKALNLKIPTKAEKWEIKDSAGRVAGINNFGFGGTNAHAVVKQHKYTNIPRTEVRKSQYFVLSAASEKSITMMIEDTAAQIISGSIADLQSLAYTSACRRSHFKHRYRKAFLTSSLTDLKEKLTSTQSKKIVASKPDPKLVFVFCGNGVTYRGMCRQLLKKEPLFRDKVKEIEALFQNYKSTNLLEKLETDSDESDDFSKPEVIQPLLFTIQVAITSLLNHWGVRPDAILGHSVGEVAAAHCSGLLSLEDAVKVIYHRSLLQSKVTGGKMLVVSNMAVSEVLKLLPSYSGKVCLAAYNSPQSCTLSGDADAISSLHKNLSNSVNSQKLFLHVLDVPAAYHSHMMDPILLNVEESIGSLQENNLVTDLFSTVTGKRFCPPDFTNGKYWAKNIRDPVAFEQAVKSAADDKKNVVFVEIGPRRALQRNIIETLGNGTTVLCSVQPDKDYETILTLILQLFELGVSVDWNYLYKGCETLPTPLPKYMFDNVKKDVIIAAKNSGTTTSHPVITQTGKDNSTFSCDLSSPSLLYLQDHKHNGVAIIPGAFYVELGLAAVMANAKPKVPLSTLQLSISFQSPFVFTQNAPDMKVQLDPMENVINFQVHSPSATYACGTVKSSKERLPEVHCISLDCIYKRCKSVVSSEEFYKYLCLGGFQYGSVFKHKGDVYYGEELREAFSVITIPEELLSHLHDYCIHPVVLDYLMQLVPVTVAHGFLARPGFPSQIGSFTIFGPLQKEMAVYLRAIYVGVDDFEVCGCFADKEGRVLVELKHVMVKYLGSRLRVVEEYFYHNSYSVISENIGLKSPPTALVFADQLGLSRALQPHLSPTSRYISFSHAELLLKHGFAALLSELNISNIKKNFQEVLFMWGTDDLTSQNTDNVLESLSSCCEILRQIVAELKAINFLNPIRTITYRSTESTADHISPGFALSGMTRACAAELSEMSFQLIDISSVSVENIKALTEVLSSYPCSKYPELVVKDGQVLKPYIIHTPYLSMDTCKNSVHFSKSENFILQTSDPYKMTQVSAIPSDNLVDHIQEKSVEVQLNKICVHSSDYFPVSVTDLTFGSTVYWNNHTTQNHKLLALDFSGTVTAVGKAVHKLRVGDQIISCYPVAASSKVVVPEAVCYKTKRLPCLGAVPCVSYIILAWELLNSVLPKAKQQRKLGILSCVPDSGLLRVLTVTTNNSGWKTKVVTNANQLSQCFHGFEAILLLPPFDDSLISDIYCISGVRDIVLVSGTPLDSSVTQSIFRGENDEIHMHILLMSNIMQKWSLKAHMPHIYRWLKSLHLDRNSLAFETTVFQRMKTKDIDLLPVETSGSYFSCQTMPVVLLKNGNKEQLSNISLLPTSKKLFQKNSVYIVTGGLSGLGFETVKFVSQRGAGNVVIFSRTNPNPKMKEEISNVQNQCGSFITTLECDVSISEQVNQAVAEIERRFPSCPIKGVFHSAVVLHDGLIESLNKSLYEKVMRPKVNGVLNLHYATRHCKLDYFVCYSSISSFLGNASQTNYASANSFMDTFCQYRRNIGLVGQSINWGALNLGLLLNKDHFKRFLEAKGMMVLEVTEIHESLEQCLLLNKPQQAICRFNFRNIRYNVLSQNTSLTMRLSALVEEGLRKAKMIDSHLEQNTSVCSPNEYIRSVISETVGVEQNELNDETTLCDLGIDSMLAMTLQNLIFQEKGISVPLVKLLDPNSTLSTLVKVLMENTEEEFLDIRDQTTVPLHGTDESTRL
ncbi:probable polyketide synthase 16 [Chanos chanos]|uniref:Probable polyketide synthase 16 n=1 Tax=Chanos chanos TaxID=29144 RepID=A0A6J2UWJ3_CHACN|nr:probable polyketide synthase 16 [Chanos chanos]